MRQRGDSQTMLTRQSREYIQERIKSSCKIETFEQANLPLPKTPLLQIQQIGGRISHELRGQRFKFNSWSVKIYSSFNSLISNDCMPSGPLSTVSPKRLTLNWLFALRHEARQHLCWARLRGLHQLQIFTHWFWSCPEIHGQKKPYLINSNRSLQRKHPLCFKKRHKAQNSKQERRFGSTLPHNSLHLQWTNSPLDWKRPFWNWIRRSVWIHPYQKIQKLRLFLKHNSKHLPWIN